MIVTKRGCTSILLSLQRDISTSNKGADYYKLLCRYTVDEEGSKRVVSVQHPTDTTDAKD